MSTSHSAHGDGRVVSIDALRGLAVLGILLMNVVSFGLPDPAYFNITNDGGNGLLDRAVGLLGEVLIDQKMMGLFSALFGASIVLFIDRVGARRRHPIVLSCWRNLLLLVIGLVHASFWEGDVLITYALCSPILLLARKLRGRTLVALGAFCMTLTAASGPLAQMILNSSGGAGQLGWYWFDQDLDAAPVVVTFFVTDSFLRALGMMLIGIAMYRSGVLDGSRSHEWYRRAAIAGLGTGIPLTVAGVVWIGATGHSWRHALASNAPTTLATAPMVIGLVSTVMLLLHHRPKSLDRLVPVGRMALTNYLSQTAIALFVLQEVFTRGELDRAELLLFTFAVWALQIIWSQWWLTHFTQGPTEWLWRVATYLRWTPIRR